MDQLKHLQKTEATTRLETLVSVFSLSNIGTKENCTTPI